MTASVLLYYHFATIAHPEEFAAQHLAFCKANNILGRILISSQGINGTCAGAPEDIDRYKTFVRHIPGFSKIWFKEHQANKNPFRKIFVRPKPELVAFNCLNPDPAKGGKHITPKQFNELYEEHKDDDNLIVIDMRNSIEFEVGHFDRALNPGVRHFRDVPEIMDKFENAKDKVVVMYCTGGIRCELATPFFKEQGFKEVYQLEGGIYNYCTQYPDGHFRGDVYVFDDRTSIHFTKDGVKTWEDTPRDRIISSCHFCKDICNRVVNDESTGGRDLIICCGSCDKERDISRVRSRSELGLRQ